MNNYKKGIGRGQQNSYTLKGIVDIEGEWRESGGLSKGFFMLVNGTGTLMVEVVKFTHLEM